MSYVNRISGNGRRRRCDCCGIEGENHEVKGWFWAQVRQAGLTTYDDPYWHQCRECCSRSDKRRADAKVFATKMWDRSRWGHLS